MCSVCSQSLSMAVATQVVKQPIFPCKYSKETFTQLKSIVEDPTLKGYLQSQINAFEYNCNLYVPKIESLIDKLGLPPLQE